MPDPVHQPDYLSHDANDPLSPDRVRATKLGAEQAIRLRDELGRLARNPHSEPSWPQVREALERAKAETDAQLVAIRVRISDQQQSLEMARKLDLTRASGFRAYNEALAALRMTEALETEATALLRRLTAP